MDPYTTLTFIFSSDKRYRRNRLIKIKQKMEKVVETKKQIPICKGKMKILHRQFRVDDMPFPYGVSLKNNFGK